MLVLLRRVSALLFRLIALFFVLLSVTSATVTFLFLNSALPTSATVVGYREVQNYAPFGLFTAEESTRYFAEMEYRVPTPSGELGVHTITASQGSHLQQYERGDSVAILYSGRNPARSKIDAPIELWGRTIIFAIIALIFGAVAAMAPFAFRLGNNKEGSSPS